MSVIHTGNTLILASRRLLSMLVICLFSSSFCLAADDYTKLTPIALARYVPPIQYKNAAGSLEKSDFKAAKLTAVHFWASWCTPCIAELVEVDKASTAYKGKGLRIIAISMDTNMDKVTQFFKEYGIKNLTPYLDNKNEAFRAFALAGLPSTVFVTSGSMSIARAEGPLDWQSAEIKEFLEKALK